LAPTRDTFDQPLAIEAAGPGIDAYDVLDRLRLCRAGLGIHLSPQRQCQRARQDDSDRVREQSS
jgi:hypothetical protein